MFGGPAVQIRAKDAADRDLIFGINSASVERDGALCAVIRTEGQLTLPTGAPLLEVTARLSFYAGLNTVEVELSVTNPRAARQSGGWWDLGDPRWVRRAVLRGA